MKSAAEIENGIVVNVVFVENNLENLVESPRPNGSLAYIGGGYDIDNDTFTSVKPFDSWVLNEHFEWVAPIEPPYTEVDSGVSHIWNESDQKWDTTFSDYDVMRRIAYNKTFGGGVEEQLDMLYWDKKNGTSNWEEAIDTIKAEFP